MSLPAYDSTKHHIGLAPVGDPLLGFVISGSYRRDPQRYGGSTKYGGTDDQVGATTLSRWTQDDFSGGGYQERFRDDVAMFRRSKNFLPHQVDDTARTVPPLLHWFNAGTIDEGDVRGVFATGGKILIMDSDRYRFYNVDDGTLVTSSDPTVTIHASAHDPADNVTYSIVQGAAGFYLYQIQPSDGTRVNLKQFPDGVTGPCRGLVATAGRDLLVAMNATLWLADVNDARDDATLTRLGRLPGRWRDAVTANGLTYMLLTDSEQKTQVVSWDGTQVLPVTDIPDNFIGNCIEVYGGRLYVGGVATDTAGTARYAEIYEITLSSVRLLKTFASEARAGLPCPTTIYDMAVHEGLLFFGTDAGYLIAYDLTRDALWPEIELYSDSGRVIEARNLLSTRERLLALGVDKNRTLPKDGFYRMAAIDADMTAAGANGAGVNVTAESCVETSEFSPEPDREKRWSQLRVLSRYAPAPTLEYSQDGGGTWTALVGVSSGSDFRVSDFDLSGLDPSESIRFRFSWDKTTVAYSELVAFTCSFLLLDSGKSGWAMTLAAVDGLENLDGSTQNTDIATMKSTLWGYWQNKTTLTYRDVEGDDFTVYISDLSEQMPGVDASGEREAFFSLTLTEV